MRVRRSYAFVLALALLAPPVSTAAVFQSPLDTPAMPSALAPRTPLLAVTTAGKRLVAVGQRGHVVFSDDGGASWKQASVPVSADLVAVSFPTARHGWAVGHGGVVLKSRDGGASWSRQLDGAQSLALAIRHFEARAASDPQAAVLLEREKRLEADGGKEPLMGVYFESETTGYVVGLFNRIFRTDDGGESWTPWMDRTENPRELHFNAITGGPDGIFLTGEEGKVWRLDPAQERFVAMPTPYNGTLFGLVAGGAGAAPTLLAFGMRGSLFRSADGGRSWEKRSIGSSAGITGGITTPDGAILLATQAGDLMRSLDQGRSFAPVKLAQPMPYYGLARTADGSVVLAGPEGVRLETVR